MKCGYLMSTIKIFDGIKTKHEVFRGKDCVKMQILRRACNGDD